MSAEAQPPSLSLLHTLANPSGVTRCWSSLPHPSPLSPLLATATSDKQVHIWDMRTWQLVSTISGGHKRSIRCVGWKDYGGYDKRRSEQMDNTSSSKSNEVLLATGSFDANAGLWVWNKNPVKMSTSTSQDDTEEHDFTRQDDDDEDWHFSTLLTGPDSEIKDLEFSPPHYSANFLATCSRDKSVWVWEEVEPEEWETVAVLTEHSGDVKCLSWCKGANLSAARRQSRKKKRKTISDDVRMDGTAEASSSPADQDEEDQIISSREILASGSYDDMIRLWRDVEEEGDWICVGVMEGHDGTVWDLKWEPTINLALYPDDVSDEEIRADWEPRVISCSDDLTVRIWKRELNESEREKKREVARSRQGDNGQPTEMTTGFASSRIPSVIRPAGSLERWSQEASLPQVHVRSIYAVDWSAKTGLVVTCGGDGTIVVYQEVCAEASTSSEADVVMQDSANTEKTTDDETIRRKSKWIVIAQLDAAHEEYEVNHVCWAPRRDQAAANGDTDAVEQEVIVSTGDDGSVRIWELPEEVWNAI